MKKSQWQKPVVQKMDIAKTKSGNASWAAEGTFVGDLNDGTPVYGSAS